MLINFNVFSGTLLENIYWTDTCGGSWNRYVIFVAYEDNDKLEHNQNSNVNEAFKQVPTCEMLFYIVLQLKRDSMILK
jgi:quinol monooxygenase YgiN